MIIWAHKAVFLVSVMEIEFSLYMQDSYLWKLELEFFKINLKNTYKYQVSLYLRTSNCDKYVFLN